MSPSNRLSALFFSHSRYRIYQLEAVPFIYPQKSLFCAWCSLKFVGSLTRMDAPQLQVRESGAIDKYTHVKAKLIIRSTQLSQREQIVHSHTRYSSATANATRLHSNGQQPTYAEQHLVTRKTRGVLDIEGIKLRAIRHSFITLRPA
jgi:hypothetical protein